MTLYNPSHILGNLYLGDCNDAHTLANAGGNEYLFLSCANEISLYSMDGKKINLFDCKNDNLFDMLDDAANFIHEYVNERKILVYCKIGKSRSPIVIIYYLMKYKKYTFEEAQRLVRLRRPIICPNHYFVHELIDYEKMQELADLLC